jgi:hypothetical protein
MGRRMNELPSDATFRRRRPRNCRLADVVATRHSAWRLTCVERLRCLALLVRSELRLASEFHALRFRIGAAPLRALQDPAAFELRSYAKDGENDLNRVRGGIKERLGE